MKIITEKYHINKNRRKNFLAILVGTKLLTGGGGGGVVRRFCVRGVMS